MNIPQTPGALIVWIVALVVIAIIAVYLFQNILLPLLETVT
jgi:Tfp pilus assembly protein PilX